MRSYSEHRYFNRIGTKLLCAPSDSFVHEDISATTVYDMSTLLFCLTVALLAISECEQGQRESDRKSRIIGHDSFIPPMKKFGQR